ncbi:MAG: hypothetical protein ABWY47_06410, partial [Xanthobacteraceae bacterium]
MTITHKAKLRSGRSSGVRPDRGRAAADRRSAKKVLPLVLVAQALEPLLHLFHLALEVVDLVG